MGAQRLPETAAIGAFREEIAGLEALSRRRALTEAESLRWEQLERLVAARRNPRRVNSGLNRERVRLGLRRDMTLYASARKPGTAEAAPAPPNSSGLPDRGEPVPPGTVTTSTGD